MSKGGDIDRRTANYHPDIWGDRFINYNSEDEVQCIIGIFGFLQKKKIFNQYIMLMSAF